MHFLLKAFAISASGMLLERMRVDLTAANIANAQSTRSADGTAVRPLRLVSAAAAPDFPSQLSDASASLRGVRATGVMPLDVPPRLVYEPGHPDADPKGFVAYPGINPVSEMVTLMTAVRAYEANVAALNAAKTMALRTLQIAG